MNTGIPLAGKSRAPIAAGLFYPERPDEAAARLRSYGLEPGRGGGAAAIIAPHGAWDISGPVAAAAFSAAAGRGQPGRGLSYVVILGIVHEVSGAGIFLSDSAYFQTPLGILPVAAELCAGLASCSTLMEINDIPHLQEQSIEVLLPFIKYCFPGVRIIPVLMESTRRSLISALAKALTIVFGPLAEHTLFVISSSLSKNSDPRKALTQAEEGMGLLREQRAEELIRGIYEDRISACGAPVAAALLESGLLADKTARAVPGPLVKTLDGDGKTVYFGGLFFE
jgi:AmmeMemoRadiSam system protein B